MQINKDIYIRLKQLVQHCAGGTIARFAQEIGQKHNTFQDYLKPSGQYKIKLSMLYEILAKYPEINPIWLLTGEGEMLENEKSSLKLQPEELDEKLTPTQREMLSYRRTMQELGAPAERIIDGIEAIAMGKAAQNKSTYKTAESPADPGYHKVHEPGSDFGKGI